jgi:Cation/multidrug efflux pump
MRLKRAFPEEASFIFEGRSAPCTTHLSALYLGLGFSLLLVYLLMVVNFQSWTEPFIIITALPCALAGIVWMLFITGTTLSVPALMGAIMCMGVATANSVLVVTFANEQLEHYHDAYRAALEAGYARIRPVLMTATGDDHRNGSDGLGPWVKAVNKTLRWAGSDWRPDLCHWGYSSSFPPSS